jgi:hypothetical protein
MGGAAVNGQTIRESFLPGKLQIKIWMWSTGPVHKEIRSRFCKNNKGRTTYWTTIRKHW